MKIANNTVLPKKYKGAVLEAPNSPLQISEFKFSSLNKGEVWIQIIASPINPSDLALVAGTYPTQKDYPFVPGLEASGIVVATGGGFMADFLLGKRVACSAPVNGDGTWAEYMKAPAGNCIPLKKALSFEQGAGAIVNPMTALALIDRIKQSGSKSFVNTAAAGALGKMLIKLARKENLTAINLVRRATQVEKLKSIGAEIVLDSSQSDFSKQLQETCKKHKTQIILDAIGGAFSNTLLTAAPENTTLVIYASLAKDLLHINPAPIIRFGKKVEGFHLAHWSSKQSKFKLIKMTRKAQKLMVDGTLAATVHSAFALPEINTAIADYANEMSTGKRILTF